MAGFEDAVQELYQAPITQFVGERKRLADELKSGGDAKAAKQLLARKRPTISAWVINQLYWHARDAFDELLATADKLRAGDLKASASHRDAIAKLRGRAKSLLDDAGHAPTEATLRRVTTTLSAIAVAGGFDPDPPGALAEDRDPPGFAAFGISPGGDEEPPAKAAVAAKAAVSAKAAKHDGDDDLAKARAKRARAKEKDTEEETEEEAPHADASESDLERAKREKQEREDERERAKADKEAAKAREAEAAAQRTADMAEKKREEAEKKRIAAERHRLEAALRAAKAELHDRERAVKQLEKQITAANKDVERSQEIVDDLARKLEEL